MIEGAKLFILCAAIIFGTIALAGFDICFKEKVKLFISLEVFLALLIIGSIVC